MNVQQYFRVPKNESSPLYTGPLDSYSSLFAVSFVRKLYSGYTGPAFRLYRNPSTTDFIDVGFTSDGMVDNVAVDAFIAISPSVDYNINFAYDQSGNARNFSIVGAGPIYYKGSTASFLLQNGYRIPNWVADASARGLTLSSGLNCINTFIFASCYTQNPADNLQGILNGAPNQQCFRYQTTLDFVVAASSSTQSLNNPSINGIDETTFGIVQLRNRTANDSQIFWNETAGVTKTHTNTQFDLQQLGSGSSGKWKGPIAECAAVEYALNDNRSSFVSDYKAFWGIT